MLYNPHHYVTTAVLRIVSHTQMSLHGHTEAASERCGSRCDILSSINANEDGTLSRRSYRQRKPELGARLNMPPNFQGDASCYGNYTDER